jgi:transcription initiation factor TFIID subunit 1
MPFLPVYMTLFIYNWWFVLQVLVKFKVPEDEIDKLTRWHRIAMVRKLSSEQAASGVKLGAAALNKFARGQRMSFLQLQQQTREKCQDIWDRQAQSLAITEGDDSESDGEANGDLDSFAGDLENLLEAEEGDEGGGKRGRREGMGGLGARRRKQLAQQEEDIEDEEAEAAELRRMLRAGSLAVKLAIDIFSSSMLELVTISHCAELNCIACISTVVASIIVHV